jgi:hypothetical protein
MPNISELNASHAGPLDSQRFRQRLQLPLPMHSFSQNREPARTGPRGSGTVNCQHCHGRGDASTYAGIDRPAQPYTGCHSRAGVCNGGTDKHTKGDRDGASPHKTPEPTPNLQKRRLTRARQRVFPLAFSSQANPNL